MRRDAERLLWIDCTGGLAVGAIVLAGSAWLSELYAVPRALVVVSGVANLLYGSFSLSLVRRPSRPRALIVLLVVANAAWSVLCVVAAIALAGRASAFGMMHIVGEALFVGGLAALEWRYRERLLGTTVANG